MVYGGLRLKGYGVGLGLGLWSGLSIRPWLRLRVMVCAWA